MCAYNAQRTINSAIRSVLPQIGDGVFLYVVDDGSTDGTPDIIRYLKNENEHHYFNFFFRPFQDHRGKSAVLADAIKSFPADYYMFCDADDCLLPGAVKALLDAAQNSQADIVMAPYICTQGIKFRIVKPRHDIRSLNDMPLDTVHFALWNKLFKEKLITSALPFPGIDRWEDLGMVARMMTSANNVLTIDKPVYNYMVDTSRPSLSRSPKEQVLADRLAIAQRLILWFELRNLTDEYAEFLNHLKFCAKIKMARKPAPDYRAWLQTYSEVNPHILHLRHIPLLARIYFTLLRLIAPLLPR